MINPLNFVSWKAYAALGVVLAFGFTFLAGQYKGRQDLKIEQVKEDVELYRSRAKIDENVQNLSDYDICQRLSGRVRNNECELLRGDN